MDQILRTATTYDAMRQAVELVPHAMVHSAVGGASSSGGRGGGDMTGMQSPNDPIFWLHHSFLDGIWAAWMQLQHPQVFSSLGAPPTINEAVYGGRKPEGGRGTASERVNGFGGRGAVISNLLDHRRLCYAYPAYTNLLSLATQNKRTRTVRRRRQQQRTELIPVARFNQLLAEMPAAKWQQAASRVPIDTWTKEHALCYLDVVMPGASPERKQRVQQRILQQTRQAEERILRIQAALEMQDDDAEPVVEDGAVSIRASSEKRSAGQNNDSIIAVDKEEEKFGIAKEEALRNNEEASTHNDAKNPPPITKSIENNPPTPPTDFHLDGEKVRDVETSNDEVQVTNQATSGHSLDWLVLLATFAVLLATS